MFDLENEINEVYKKADELFNIRIKSQLKGSGLVFERFHHVTDMLTGEKLYNLIINKNVIPFNSSVELYKKLLQLIEHENKEVLNQLKAIENNGGFAIDDFHLESLHNKENKLSQLSERIKTLLKKENNS